MVKLSSNPAKGIASVLWIGHVSTSI